MKTKADKYEKVLRKNGSEVRYLFSRNGVYYSLFRHEGKNIRRRCPYSTMTDAEAWVVALRRDLIEGEKTAGLNTERRRSEYPTVDDVCNAYMAMIPGKYAADGSPNPKTARENVWKLKTILAEVHGVDEPGAMRFNEETINRRTPELFHALRMRKALENPLARARSRTTSASTLVAAKSIFAAWTKWKYHDAGILLPPTLADFCGAIHSRKPEKYRRPPEALIERTLREWVNLPAPQRAIFLLCYRFGMRRDEARNTRWDWVVPCAGGRGIRIDMTLEYSGAKNKKSRVVPGTTDTWALLDALRTDDPYICTAGAKEKRKEAAEAVSAWMRGIGWDEATYSKTLHELRKLVGSAWCDKAGADRAAQWLGDTMQTTMHYYVDVIGERPAVEV
jgi:integrase